ncbi:MAG TPA: hypothetical protein ENN28_04675 [Candidatus Uhrbacteria bacterium]|nr:hypothetical protein [Candidatus Uhrbacteria bacterium]
MSYLDWAKIDNEKHFQVLVNDLVSFELNKPGFIPSSPYIGADGGWDAKFTGEYLNLTGIWSFQSKWSKLNGKKAFDYLKKSVKEELEKAQKNKVDYLVLATNAELIVNYIEELKKINNGHVKDLIIWDKAYLDILLNKWYWLRQNYFGNPQYPMFVPSSTYFETIENKLLEGDLLEQTNTTDSVKIFIKDVKAKILVIHAPGGYGKSNFLKSLTEKVYETISKRLILFCRPGIRSFSDAVNDELASQYKYLLVLDDAERYPEITKCLIAFSRASLPEDIKIVFACRTSGLTIIDELLKNQRLEAFEYKFLKLDELSEQGLIELLSRSAGNTNIKNADRIIKAMNKIPYYIVTIGKTIGKKDIDPNSIKTHIENTLEEQTIDSLKGEMLNGQIESLLTNLATIVPLDLKDDFIQKKLSEVVGITSEKVIHLIKKMRDSEILRDVGNSIRFNPDMAGDLYLSQKFDSKDGEDIINQLLENWLPLCNEKIVANLADASRHMDTASAQKAISNFINLMIKKSSNINEFGAHEYLKMVAPLAFLAPNETVNLLHTYLDSLKSKLSRDDIGLVIDQLSHVPGYQNKALLLIDKMVTENLKGLYNNYEPQILVRNLTSPIELNIASASESLSELIEWVQKEDCSKDRAELASDGAKEALSGSHQFRESYADSLTIGRKFLDYDKFKIEIDEFRNKAMILLEKLIKHPFESIRIYALNIIDEIGHEANPNTSLWQRILKDKDSALNLLEFSLQEEQNEIFLNLAEDLLIKLWANNEIYGQISEKAGSLL